MLTRRALLGRAVAAAPAGLSAPVVAQGHGRVPQRPSARVIVDNDFAGDPDSLVALAHQLLTPKRRVVLVTSSALDPKMAGSVPLGRSAAIGSDIAKELIRRSAIADAPQVLAGSEVLGLPLSPPSTAARAIVAEALRADSLPLIVTCGGPLTNIAAALQLEPRIATRMTVIWIGGGRYPEGGWEYNMNADLAAARHVIEQSRVSLWQVPQSAYRQMQVSIAEMTDQLRPVSPFGAWLYSRFTTPTAFVEIGGSWPWGDTPTVLLSAISAESSAHVDRTAQRIADDGRYGAQIAGRTIRVFETLDVRLAIADFMALMHLHASDKM